jgi:hypothetical protein
MKPARSAVSDNILPGRAAEKRTQTIPVRTARAGCLLLVESGFDKADKSIDGVVFVGTVGKQRDGHTLDDTERKHAEKAFGIDSAILALNPYRTFE